MKRRSFLRGVGVVGGALSVGCTVSESSPQKARSDLPTEPWPGAGSPDREVFPLGVQSGDPEPDGVVIWTQSRSDVGELLATVMVWNGAWTEHATTAVEVTDGGFVHLMVDGLNSDQSIAFQFSDGVSYSAVGHAITAIAADSTANITFGASSCLSADHGDFPSLTRLVEAGHMDLFLQLGDSVYADGSETVEEFREFWAENLMATGMADVAASTPQLYTLDDHEIHNNFDQEDISGAVIDAGRDAFFENTPVRRHDDEPTRIWRSYKYGKTAEFFVLDCRTERNRKAGIYISPEQMDWLIDGLSKSDATWKVILNSVPITEMPEVYNIERVVYDRWYGYPFQRNQLLDSIHANAVKGVLFVSGDLHHPLFARVEETGYRSNIFEVLVGPAGSTVNPLAVLIETPEQYLWADSTWCGTRFELTHSGMAHITVIDEKGGTLLDCFFRDSGEVVAKFATHSYEVENRSE